MTSPYGNTGIAVSKIVILLNRVGWHWLVASCLSRDSLTIIFGNCRARVVQRKPSWWPNNRLRNTRRKGIGHKTEVRDNYRTPSRAIEVGEITLHTR
jgi:hypothetical protein